MNDGDDIPITMGYGIPKENQMDYAGYGQYRGGYGKCGCEPTYTARPMNGYPPLPALERYRGYGDAGKITLSPLGMGVAGLLGFVVLKSAVSKTVKLGIGAAIAVAILNSMKKSSPLPSPALVAESTPDLTTEQ